MSSSYYEIAFIVRQNANPSEVDSLSEKLTKILSEKGGKLCSKEYWGLKELAYKITKNTKGHYVALEVEASPEAIAEVRRIIGFTEDIIRSSIFKIDSLREGPSELMVCEHAKDYSDSTKAPIVKTKKEIEALNIPGLDTVDA